MEDCLPSPLLEGSHVVTVACQSFPILSEEWNVRQSGTLLATFGTRKEAQAFAEETFPITGWRRARFCRMYTSNKFTFDD